MALFLSSSLASLHARTPMTLHVAPNGSDNATGATPATALASCAGAVSKLSEQLATHGLPPGGLTVSFAAGIYHLNASTACGSVAYRATAAAPIVFASSGSAVTFDGTRRLDASSLSPVTNASIRALLQPSARDKVLALVVPASAGWTGGPLAWNGVPLSPSVWPNTGLGYVRRVFDRGAVYAEGRTKGPRPHCHVCNGSEKSTSTSPCGGNISLAEQPGGDWAAELVAGPGFGSISVTGYFAADWYSESHHVAKVVRTPTNTSLQFASYSRYGLCEALEDVEGGCAGSAPGRFTVSGLLSEVDAPGEFFYNAVTRTLYVYPPSDAAIDNFDQVDLGYRDGPGLISMANASWVTVKGLSVTGSTGVAVSITGGEHNTVGGCTLSQSAGGVSLNGGHHNRVVGNDIYDVGSHIDSGGNDGDDVRDLVPTSNLIANNHLTQVHERGAWQIRLRGMGDRFTHNLIHDASGQLLLPGGPLTMIDGNEIFNTGYAEGDGGVMYSGASLTAGYGMQYRENFIHHSLEVPGLHGRGGIYFDDYESSVSNCSGNVMYKAAGRAFLVNGGAANNITHNLCINGGVGIYNQHAENMVRDLPLYDNGTLKRGDKGDYIWRTEQTLGVGNFSALFGTPLAARFPTFSKLLSVNSTLE